MRSPCSDGGREQGTQSGDDSDPDCENKNVIHERFFFKTRTITSLVPRDASSYLIFAGS
jgi:hypothetical protein